MTHKADLSRTDLSRVVFWLGAGSVVVLAALSLIPAETLERMPVFCPFRHFLGMECYGCGMTRALCALLHGRLKTALVYNRGVLVVLPALCCAALALPARLARSRYA